MKKTFTLIFVIIVTLINAQVIIGDATGTAVNKTSVLLEFAAGQNKGLILPYVRTMPTTPTEGTIVLDASTGTSARVKYYNANSTAGTNGWVDLSGQDANLTTTLATQPTGVAESSSKVIIGADTSTADGVLVLESTNKAMVLPIVADTNAIPSPSPGMMVYINKAGAKRLAVFNGSKWSYWKP